MATTSFSCFSLCAGLYDASYNGSHTDSKNLRSEILALAEQSNHLALRLSGMITFESRRGRTGVFRCYESHPIKNALATNVMRSFAN